VKRTPVRGVKEYLKPSIYKQWKRYASVRGNARPRAFCIMSRLVTLRGKAKQLAEP
jgi:hypothetical protein